MPQPNTSTWEFTLCLPLGVVENQLRKIEEELRTLSMKAVDFGERCEDRPTRARATANLESIGGLVESIADLVTRLDADIRPVAAALPRKPPPEQDD